ncbi:MAG TPA: glycosyltransferase [Thermoleophilaceae bacterium]|nr:glycosyltransferase [Thermoleophilaceae bacterium]
MSAHGDSERSPGSPPRAAADAALPDPATFLSGDSGTVAGRRLTLKRTLADWACELAGAATRAGPRLDRLAAGQPPRQVLVLSIYRPGSLLPSTIERLRSERHDVRFALGATREPEPALAADTVLSGLDGGKFENLNRLLAAAPAESHDWLVVADDDVELAPRFLDRCIALCERLAFDIAQPAQTQRSHAAWRVTRRRPLSLARRTDYVEIGPVTLFSRRAAAALTPFPELRFGWGLDNHWAALARERGWRLGIVDALPVRHESQRVASTYSHADAIEEGRRFLAGRPYVRTEEAQRTLATYRRLPS